MIAEYKGKQRKVPPYQMYVVVDDDDEIETITVMNITLKEDKLKKGSRRIQRRNKYTTTRGGD